MNQTSAESIRLFRNDFLESLTHVHPIIPLVFWGPVAAVLLYRSVWVYHLPIAGIAAIAVAALIAWTLTEYLAHRFIFHFNAQNRVSRYLVFMFHGVHHDAPNDKSRLVMPPAGAILLMALFAGFFRLFIPSPWIEPFLGFFIIGYLMYDYIHYATHHFRMRSRVARYLKHYHMRHHFVAPDANYGVSSPLWDYVFGTREKRPST